MGSNDSQYSVSSESKQQIRGEPSKLKGVEERTGVTKSSPKHLIRHLGRVRIVCMSDNLCICGDVLPGLQKDQGHPQL